MTSLTSHCLTAIGRHGQYHVCCRRPLLVGAVLGRLARAGLMFSPDFHLASATEMISAAAFIEPSPYLARDLWHDAARLLTARGWDVHLPTRFQLTDAAEPSVAARADWAVSRNAGLTLIDASGPETPPGAALIIGACAATGRPVLAADPGAGWTFADGREPNWRNLMIQYAISGRFTTISELAAMVDSR